MQNIEDGKGMLQCYLSQNTLDDIFAKYSKVKINLWGSAQTHIVAFICNFNARLPDYNVEQS